VGAASTSLTIAAGSSVPGGNIVVNKTGGTTLSLASSAVLTGSGQNLSLTAGSLLMNGFALTVPGTLTIGAGTTLTRGGGVLTYGALTNNGTLNP
jgi:hypothetical protein